MERRIVLDSLDALRAALREERRRRGLSQATLAGMTGYSRKWLSDFERGASDPPAGMVLRMARLMGARLELAAPSPAPDEPAPDQDGL